MYARRTGIYIIQSKAHPDRIYVGCASIFRQRWNQHKRELNSNEHHSPQLQRHFNKYGQKDLVFEIIEEGEYCCKEHLLAREQGWMTHFRYKNSDIPYFNCDKIAGSRLGAKASAETIVLLKLQRKGRKMKGKKGYKYTPEQSERRSEQQMGAKNHQFGKFGTTEGHKRGAEKRRGLKQSEETKLRKMESLLLGFLIKEMEETKKNEA
jgi:group I intron endonuclease